MIKMKSVDKIDKRLRKDLQKASQKAYHRYVKFVHKQRYLDAAALAASGIDSHATALAIFVASTLPDETVDASRKRAEKLQSDLLQTVQDFVLSVSVDDGYHDVLIPDEQKDAIKKMLLQ